MAADTPKGPYTYNVVIDRVVDGDTIDVHIDLGFDCWLRHQRVRLAGIDAPESRTKDLLEKKFGLITKGVVEAWCKPGAKVVMATQLRGREKFGRILGTIFFEGDGGNCINLNHFLIENRHAVKYNGENKELMKEAHLENFQYLQDSGRINLANH